MMKKQPLVLLFLLMPVFAATWESRCTSYSYNDFEIYEPKYLECISAAKIDFHPNVYSAELQTDLSRAIFLSQNMPLLPLVEDKTITAIENSTALIPFQYLEGELNVRLVGKLSDSYICKEKTYYINDTSKTTCAILNLDINITYNPDKEKFHVDIKNLESFSFPVFVAIVNKTNNQVLEVYSIYAEANSENSADSNNLYDSEDVSKDSYIVYVYAEKNDAYYLRSKDFFEFYDVKVNIGEIPKFLPKETKSFDIEIKNTGTLVDCYDIDLEASKGLEVSSSPVGCLEKGENKIVNITFSVPETYTGNGYILIILNSEKGGFVRKYNVSLEPKKAINMEILLKKPDKYIQSFSWNDLNATLVGKSTAEATVFYTVYTEPSLRIKKGEGSIKFISGSLNKLNDVFYVGSSCAFNTPDDEAYRAARRIEIYLDSLFYAVSNNIEDGINKTIGNIQTDEIFIKASSTATSKLLTKINEVISDVENYFECGDDLCKRNQKEETYLDLVKFKNALDDYALTASSKCYDIDKVKFHLFAYYPDSGASWDKVIEVEVKGKNIIDLIGPKTIYLIPGRRMYVSYKLKNNADQDLELNMNLDFDYATYNKYVYLPAGEEKEVRFKFNLPDFYETRGENITLEIKGRGLDAKYNLTIVAGQFNPKFSVESSYTVIPGQENILTFDLLTNGIDEEFMIFLKAPYWVELLNKTIITKDGKGKVYVRIHAPPEVTISKEYITLTAVPKHFTDEKITASIKLIVSNEVNEIKQKFDQLMQKYEEIKDDLNEVQRNNLERIIEDTREAINNGAYTRAKLGLLKIDQILSSIEPKEEKKTNVFGTIIKFTLFFALFGALSWFFLIPKFAEIAFNNGWIDEEFIEKLKDLGIKVDFYE